MLAWPKEVKSIRRFLPGGVAEYRLSHSAVGELGRIILSPAGMNGCVVSHEIFAADDGHMSRREEILEQLSKLVHEALDQSQRLQRKDEGGGVAS
jgi:hypothetical protein